MMKHLYICITLLFAVWANAQEQKSYPLSAFTGLEVKGNFEVQLVYGSEHKVELSAENSTDLQKTTVTQKGDKVVIENKKMIGRRIVATIYATHFQTLSFAGSSQVTASQPLQESSLSVSFDGSGNVNLATEIESSLSLKINGSGDMYISGKAKDADLVINGSGKIEAPNLNVKNASAKINGSGDCTMGKVESSIEVKINGSGDVTYSGSPSKTSTKINGSGQVKTME